MSNRMKSIPKKVNLVEDDLYDEHAESRVFSVEPSIVRPRPVRIAQPTPLKPVAMQVVRPTPKRISEQYYNEAYQEGLTNKETGDAAVLAHEWHRKWTHQEETHHAQVEHDFYQQGPLIPSYFNANVDRQGASNPFLGRSFTGTLEDNDGLKRFRSNQDAGLSKGAEEEVYFNPEDRLTPPSWSDDVEESSSSSEEVRRVKRRNTSHFDGEHHQVGEPHEAPIAVRPLAVRPMVASRPVAPVAHDHSHGHIPKKIFAHHELSVSPMSEAYPEEFFMTIMNGQDEEIHLIEDDQGNHELSDDLVLSDPVPCSLASATLAKDGVLHALAVTKGDVDSDKFKMALDPLLKHANADLDSHSLENSVDGMWLQLSKPTYFGCLGENDRGDPMYTLGRMAFDMFSPTNLVCSLQGNFNPIEIVDDTERLRMLDAVPKRLREEVERGETVLRTYHIVTAFTIEATVPSCPNAPNKDVVRPIRGIMTTYGYSLPDPNVPNRDSIWFTGGSIEPNSNPADVAAWKRLFTMHPPKHTFGEKAKLLAVKLLMGATVPDGMDENGRMEFAFTRPLGGHGTAYVDVIYLDESLRIVRGHRGTIMVFSRLHQK